MSEYQMRIKMQRNLLRKVNNRGCDFSLNGISSDSIDRWCADNQIDLNSDLVLLIKKASKCLQFLANRSQETIYSDYQIKMNTIKNIIEKI